MGHKPMPLGRALAIRYEMLSTLGEGTLGDLHLVRDRSRGDTLALRLTDFAAAPVVLEALANVVALHDRLAPRQLPLARVRASGADGERAWYVMDALDGESLLSQVRSSGPLAAPQACQLL